MAAAAQDRDHLLAEIPRLSETIGNMSDEIARLRTPVAGLTEDPTGAYGDMGEGPAVRARQYQHALDSDRREFSLLMERVNDLENSMAFLTANQTDNS